MRPLDISKQPWIIAGLLLVIAGPALGQQWQQQRKGQYLYRQDGYNQAFPLGSGDRYYFSYRGPDGSRHWWRPDYQDPQTRQIRYRGLWTNGSQIFESYSTQNFWTEWHNCNLAVLKGWADEKNRAVISQAQSDYFPFYVAERDEAVGLLSACKQMISRRGG